MEESLDDHLLDNDGPSYRPACEIQTYELVEACYSLKFFKDDAFLRMQGHNLALIDGKFGKIDHLNTV